MEELFRIMDKTKQKTDNVVVINEVFVQYFLDKYKYDDKIYLEHRLEVKTSLWRTKYVFIQLGSILTKPLYSTADSLLLKGDVESIKISSKGITLVLPKDSPKTLIVRFSGVIYDNNEAISATGVSFLPYV